MELRICQFWRPGFGQTGREWRSWERCLTKVQLLSALKRTGAVVMGMP